ncbi:phosphatidate cytidylyltransferase [Phnomibacter sp. MR]|uniref:phosphatidate cytidylyltransferase n=1 Tax=Phnomibacter sp. MR TaxID=3042318 RepID=UPI003A7FC1B3
MALNTAVFKTRALSAIVFVIIMLGGLLWNHWSFLLLFSIIHVGCWWEYFNLQEKIQQTHYSWLERVGLILMGFSILLAVCGRAFQIQGYGLAANTIIPVSAAGIVLFLYGLFTSRQPVKIQAIIVVFAGLLYISGAWAFMLLLRQTFMMFKGNFLFIDFGFTYPILLIASIWINDTMAYIVGSMIGKTPLSKISPKKTWEGTIGGALLAVVVVTGVAFWLKADWKITAAIAATAAVTGTLGDLFESFLKRRAGVKDSGNMMPGHGGFLDRFDSLLIATPFVWLVVKIFE